MKAEVEIQLEKAREDLSDAKKLAAISMTKLAARSAYFAAFHAAEALIFELGDKVVKTHSGVHTELARLLKDRADPRPLLPKFLAKTYKYKEISDYGGVREVVTEAQMRDAIAGAQRFVEEIVDLLKG